MNEQLEQLESQLAEMSQGKRLFIYGVIFFSAIYMSWVLYAEELSQEIVTSEDQIISLESKLMKNSTRSLEKAILKSKKDILVLEDAINHLHFQKQFVQTKLQSIDFIFYNEMGSAEILDDILKHSIDQNINLESIQKTTLEPKTKGLIEEKSRILISGDGSLRAITSLHHYIENLNALLSTESLHVEIDDNNATYFELKLLHYGVDI